MTPGPANFHPQGSEFAHSYVSQLSLISPFMVSLEKGRDVRRLLTEELEMQAFGTSGLEFSFLFSSKFCCLGLVNL